MSTQNMEALALANEIRLKSVRLRRRIYALPQVEAYELVAALLEDDDLPRHIDGMRVEQLLTAIRRIGVKKLGHIRRDAGLIRRDVRIRNLTAYEKARLARALRQRAALGHRASSLPPHKGETR